MARNQHSYSRGQWRVQRQRAQIDPGPPPKPFKEADPVGPAVEGLVKKLGIAPETWLNELSDHWADIVGSDVAAHTRPGLIQNSCLVVYVDSSAWLMELSRMAKRSMLNNLQKRYTPSRIKDVRLQLDPDQTRG